MADFAVFIVDDDDDDFYIIQEAFVRVGNSYDLQHIKSGKLMLEQLSYIQQTSRKYPDLILLDINMPKMDGVRALELIKKEEAYCQIPVIIYSTSSSPEQKDKCMGLGAKAVVLKGWNFEKVIAFAHRIDRFLCDPAAARDIENNDEDETDEIRTVLL
jgi:CheY-like chemotaxis protein